MQRKQNLSISEENLEEKIKYIVSNNDFLEMIKIISYVSLKESNKKIDFKYKAFIILNMLSKVFEYKSNNKGNHFSKKEMNDLYKLTEELVNGAFEQIIKNADTKYGESSHSLLSYMFNTLVHTQQWSTLKYTCFRDATRIWYIMNELNDLVDDGDRIDFEKPLKEKYGCSVTELYLANLFFYEICDGSTCYFNNKDILDKNEHRYSLIKSILKEKSLNIYEYNGKINVDTFRLKPFIKIGETYCIPCMPSVYDMIKNLEYWTVRDYYNNDKFSKEEFPEAFGHYFEAYVNQLLKYYLKEEYIYHYNSNIDKGSIPDFKITIGKYVFFIEVKSYISQLSCWDIYNGNNISKQIDFFEKLQAKAESQLLTQKYKGKKIRVNLILGLEKVDIINCFEGKYINLGNNNVFYISIEEFESLLELYKSAPGYFQKIMSEKLKICNKEKTNKSFEVLINETLHNHSVPCKFLEGIILKKEQELKMLYMGL